MDIKNFFTNKKLLIVGAILIMSAIVVIVSIMVIGDVSKKPSNELITAVDTTWNSAKSEEEPTYLKKLDELSSYELNSVKREDDTYVIKATVTAPDLGGQLSQLDYSEFPQNNNVDDINTFLCEQIEKSKIKKTTAEVYAYKINGEYHISFSNGFADAMSGNLYSYSQTALVDILQKYEKGELK